MAGLTANAVAQMRAGKVPSLERAARVADVVGLELCLRRKGETISPWALRLALESFLRHRHKAGGASPMTEDEVAEGAERLAGFLIQLYGPFAEVFDPSTCDDPEDLFRISRLLNRHLQGVGSEDIERFSAALKAIAAPAAAAEGGEAGQADGKPSAGGDDDASAP